MERQVELAQQITFVLKLNGVKPPHISFQIVLPGGMKGIIVFLPTMIIIVRHISYMPPSVTQATLPNHQSLKEVHHHQMLSKVRNTDI